jgi:hypothetical protein
MLKTKFEKMAVIIFSQSIYHESRGVSALRTATPCSECWPNGDNNLHGAIDAKMIIDAKIIDAKMIMN